MSTSLMSFQGTVLVHAMLESFVTGDRHALRSALCYKRRWIPAFAGMTHRWGDDVSILMSSQRTLGPSGVFCGSPAHIKEDSPLQRKVQAPAWTDPSARWDDSYFLPSHMDGRRRHPA